MQSLKKIHAWAQMKVPLYVITVRTRKEFEILEHLPYIELYLYTVSYVKHH